MSGTANVPNGALPAGDHTFTYERDGDTLRFAFPIRNLVVVGMSAFVALLNILSLLLDLSLGYGVQGMTLLTIVVWSFLAVVFYAAVDVVEVTSETLTIRRRIFGFRGIPRSFKMAQVCDLRLTKRQGMPFKGGPWSGSVWFSYGPRKAPRRIGIGLDEPSATELLRLLNDRQTSLSAA